MILILSILKHKIRKLAILKVLELFYINFSKSSLDRGMPKILNYSKNLRRYKKSAITPSYILQIQIDRVLRSH